MGEELARHLLRHAGHRLERVAGRREHRLGRAEVLEQRALARRPDARELVEEAGLKIERAEVMQVVASEFRQRGGDVRE